MIPKALRTALGITPDTQLELIPDGAGLRIEPVRRERRPVEVSDGLPSSPDPPTGGRVPVRRLTARRRPSARPCGTNDGCPLL
ncbi:MAG TPA: AbrB/MazE/SpoVT family DNA-binding domain-containing protein [Mycobacterium sp.]|nr:AbrB/MazE/SpoVT family DNA-binding domain-containing protein [Mycobacterium sp.]